MRGTALLTLAPPPYNHPRFDSDDASPYMTSCLIGLQRWGPHSGNVITQRGKDSRDFRRRLFRGLAVPINDSVDAGPTLPVTTLPVTTLPVTTLPVTTLPVTTLPVTRFIYTDPDGCEVVAEKDEDERCIDVQDILSELAPDGDEGMVSSPPRDAYGIALPALPHYTYYLHELSVSTSKLRALLEFLSACHARKEDKRQRPDLAHLISTLFSGSEGSPTAHISWLQFDGALGEYTVSVAAR